MKNKTINFLASGIQYANAVNTVSPTYAKEILQAEFSCGLGEVLASRKPPVTGILNGIDYAEWNPQKDPVLIPYNYGPFRLWRKAKLKIRLQQEAGLPCNPEIPLFGIVTRLTGQKGIDLLAYPDSPAFEAFRKGLAQLVILGTGEKPYEQAFIHLSKTFSKTCSANISFSNKYSRLIEAGSDFFLMPSRYEPCGLNQIYSLRYGTLPVVRRTGGLADTIIDLDENPNSGNGFVFDEPLSESLNVAIKRAISFYSKGERIKAIQRRAMKIRFDWNTSSKAYEALYTKALKEI